MEKIRLLPMKFKLLSFCLIVVGWSGICHAKALEVGCLDFPPYYVVKEGGIVEGGVYVDFLKEVLNKIGVEYTVAGYPPSRLYNNVAEGKTNIWMGTVGVAAYADKVIVSPEKITNIELRVYTMGDVVPLKSKDELKGKKLISIYGYNYGGLIKFLEDPANNITLDPSPSHEAGFKKLMGKRGDYLLDYKMPAEKVMAEMNLKPSDFQHGEIMNIEIYFNINKDTPDAEGLMTKMMDAFHTLKAEGKASF